MKIYQVEISNYCNLSCKYCPHPSQYRKKGIMSQATFEQVLLLAKKCGQKYLYLHNFGEPLLHPNLEQYITMAREKGIECSFYTNGILLNSERIKSLFNAGLRRISISNHTKNTSSKVLKEMDKANCYLDIEEVYNPTFLHDWCGQVEFEGCTHLCTKTQTPCIFEKQNAFVVLWNGDVASCCLDCNGISCKSRVEDLINGEYIFTKSILCRKCDLMRGDEQL